MTIINTIPGAPPEPVELSPELQESRCFICGGKPTQCEWWANLLMSGEMGWHARPLGQGLIPEYAQGLGEIFMMADRATGQVRPRLLLPTEVDGEVILAKIMAVAAARAEHLAKVTATG